MENNENLLQQCQINMQELEETFYKKYENLLNEKLEDKFSEYKKEFNDKFASDLE